jgi:hypothetical protein
LEKLFLNYFISEGNNFLSTPYSKKKSNHLPLNNHNSGVVKNVGLHDMKRKRNQASMVASFCSLVPAFMLSCSQNV